MLLHIRTHTMIEFLRIDDNMPQLSPGTKRMQLVYMNKYGLEENYLAAVHYSLVEFADQVDVLDSAILFFKEWMTWMDNAMEIENKTKIN